jgi:hypothetical protein
MTHLEAREKLIDELKRHIKPGKKRRGHHDRAGRDHPRERHDEDAGET